MKSLPHWKLVLTLLLAAPCSMLAAEKSPVYIFLYSRITDHVNIELSEDRLRRVLPMLERYRKAHPEAHVSATILFSGAISQALADRNAQTGIKDLVLDYARRGVIEIGYDGADEPTYVNRPKPDFANAKTPEDRWVARGTAAERFLTEGRDPLTGNPVAGSGGLKKMQEVFGEATCVTGVTEEVGGDSEVLHHLDQYNTKAIMFGIAEANPARIPGYRGSAAGFGTQMSPSLASSPEFYWQDNVLRSSEISVRNMRVVHSDEGANGIKAVVAGIDRSKIHIIHVELASERMSLYADAGYPPLKLAYSEPPRAKLPPTALRDADDLNYAYAKEEGLIKWLIEDFFPANAGSRFVSSTDLKHMTPPSTGFSVSVENLRSALADMLKAWGNDTYLPIDLQVDGHYLSLADMFQVMTDALAELNRAGKLPRTVQVVKVYGPIETPGDHGPNLVEVSVGAVARAAADLASHLHDNASSSVPKNVIPTWVSIDGTSVNSAQFLRLMAESLIASSPNAKLRTKMTYMLSVSGLSFPETRPPSDQGPTWTFKPAPLDQVQASRSEP